MTNTPYVLNGMTREGIYGIVDLRGHRTFEVVGEENSKVVCDMLNGYIDHKFQYKTTFDGSVDLGDQSLYSEEYTSKSTTELIEECQKRLTYATEYMKESYGGIIDWGSQAVRVSGLQGEFRKHKTETHSKLFWMGFLYCINDEIENMC